MNTISKKIDIINILIPSIDSIKAKNILQFSSLSGYGVHYIAISNEVSERNLNINPSFYDFLTLYKVGSGHVASIRRLGLIIKLLLSSKLDIAEIYPDGFYDLISTFILWCFGVRLIFIARGQEKFYIDNKMRRAQKLFFRMSYVFCNNVIIKERYMGVLMEKFRVNHVFELPNSISVDNQIISPQSNKCHFIFANSFKYFRRPELCLEAYINIARRNAFRPLGVDIKFYMIGYDLGDNKESRDKVLKLVEENPDLDISLVPFISDIKPYLNSCDVFLLPASLVYVNNSLLEAMAMGLCPIIQDTPDSNRLVVSNVSGYVLDCDKRSWEMAMLQCIFDSPKRINMGINAREHVKKNFSNISYANKYYDIYSRVLNS